MDFLTLYGQGALAVEGIVMLQVRPTLLQWSGVVFYLGGVWIYLYPAAVPIDQRLGLSIAFVGVLANAFSALLGRAVNRRQDLSSLQITVISMGCGSAVLLVTGIAVQGLPRLSWASWIIAGWLAMVNSAFAFTLLSHL